MRNQIIDNLRGISMLGVIAIHIGSFAGNTNNFTLYMLLEILSRYSIPAFFFISGYGLFVTDKNFLTGGSLDYKSFLFKRFKAVLVPYIVWSLLYQAYFYLYSPPGWIIFNLKYLSFILWFGTGCYHLYFMVVLLWFYAFYPLWRVLLRKMQALGWVTSFSLLFLFQIIFNYISVNFKPTDLASWSYFWRNMYEFRWNYIPLHYIFVFMLGGFVAIHWEECKAWLRKNFLLSFGLFIGAIILDVGSCYYYKAYKGYSLLMLANTFHQLSPQGLVYTISAIIFFTACLIKLEEKVLAQASPVKFNSTTQASSAQVESLTKTSSAEAKGFYKTVSSLILKLSTYATLMYYCHPLILHRLELYATSHGVIPTSKKIILAFFLTVLGAFLLSYILKQIFKRCKLLSLLFVGK